MRQGRFAGRELAALSQGELLDLLAEAGISDPQSSSLLEAYLDRRFPDWREAEREGPAAAGSAGMGEQEALEILGLQKGAGPDAIKEAHRRLMTKVHPDSGGSNFLAAQINRAKDLLLGKAHGD
ncbi:MAG: DnaJ domain-containing protein [Geminicoccaceae bacterium]